MLAWRTLFFSPQEFVPQTNRPEAWNRGAYLVNGLAHCASCHTPRNMLGATQDAKPLTGGLIPVKNWYAPSLVSTPVSYTHLDVYKRQDEVYPQLRHFALDDIAGLASFLLEHAAR